MSRILLLLVFLLWMAWIPAPGDRPMFALETSVGLFIGVFVLLVLGMGLWSRQLARQAGTPGLHRSLRRFNRMMTLARAMVPAWFGVGMFALGWGWAVRGALGPVNAWPVELPAVLLGTLPAFLAWMGLWWSQYPADRALREQSLLIHLDQNLPVHAPPGFWRYLTANLRLQLLFTVVPVLLILAARDVVAVALRQFDLTRDISQQLEGGMMLAAALGVFIIAPEILRRVLPTQPLPDSPLRRRLENLCRRNGLRYRDILLWHTENNMGNAAVMGIIPRVRYILLSDLLLETMTDDQIEAVFAHEVGHIVHRHMSWYVVFILILTMLLAGPGAVVAGWLEGWQLPRWMPPELLMTLIGAGAFLLAFGYLSRRFERQADVFAARSVRPPAPAQATPAVSHASPSPADCVNPHGAAIFSSALQRVAAINNIPVTAPSWCHGSIANRMTYLRSICQDPQRTALFDRSMRRVYTLLLAALLLLGAWIAVELYQDRRQAMANPSAKVQAR